MHQGMTALHYAAARGSTPIVQILAKFDAPLDAEDSAGMTALHAAVIHDRYESVMLPPAVF
jgi:ankyrin repeat protein